MTLRSPHYRAAVLIVGLQLGLIGSACESTSTSSASSSASPSVSGGGKTAAPKVELEEAKNDKKHVKGWTGTPENLTELVKWLATLKTPPKK